MLFGQRANLRNYAMMILSCEFSVMFEKISYYLKSYQCTRTTQ